MDTCFMYHRCNNVLHYYCSQIHLSEEDNALDVDLMRHRRTSWTSVQRPCHPSLTRNGSLPPLASVLEHDETASESYSEKARYHSRQYPTERSKYSPKPTGEQQPINGIHKHITRSVTLPDLGNHGSNSPYNSMVRNGIQLSPRPKAGGRRHSGIPQDYQRQTSDLRGFQPKRSPIPSLLATAAVIESGDSWSSRNSELLTMKEADTDTTTLASSIDARPSQHSSFSSASSVAGSEITSETAFTSQPSESSGDNKKDAKEQ